MPHKAQPKLPSEILTASKKVTRVKRVVEAQPSFEEAPKMTKEQAIASALLLLRNYGLLPVSMEVQPAENAERIAAQKQATVYGESIVARDDGSIGLAKKQSNVPGTQNTIRESGRVEMSLSDLNQSISAANNEVTALLERLQPYLPQYLFQPEDECKGADEDSEFELQPTSGSNLTPTQVSVHTALNELNQVRRRIRKLTNWVVI